MLTVLRGTDPQPTDESQVAPLPTLDDLPGLVDQAGRAGVSVHLTSDSDMSVVPRAVSLSAYRIVQEALTNVVKHAGPVDADVTVAVEPGRVSLTIRNGPPPGGRVTVPAGAATDRPGSGLVGMRERVAAFDGQLSAHGTDDGGWTVHATLTVEEPQ